MPDPLSKLKFYDKEDRPWPSNRLTSSAIVGHVTTTTARIWVRVHKPGTYCLIVSETEIDSKLRPAVSPAGKVMLREGQLRPQPFRGQSHCKKLDYSTDLTSVFWIRKLNAGKRYYYALFDCADRDEPWEIGRDYPHCFRTAPSRSENVTIGLYSCHMPFKGKNVLNMNMWQSFMELLEDTDADFTIGCGDQVYTDGDKRLSIWAWLKSHKDEMLALSDDEQQDVMLSWYRDIYRGYWGDEWLRKVFRNYPSYMIWDDHEIMDGWGSYTQKELSQELDTIWEWENEKQNLRLANNMFEAAKKAYGEYQHSHNPDTDENQWDYSFSWSQLACFVFDMRGHRRYDRRPGRSKILGDDQWDRFENWLKKPQTINSPAVLIVSPVPVVHVSSFITNTLDLPALGIADDLRDEWEHHSNRDGRKRLLKNVFDFSQRYKKPVLFLSGDVHLGAAFKLQREGMTNAKVFQLTSSAITYAKSPGKLLKLVVRNRGTIDVGANNPRTSFERLHLFEDNNFGLIHVRKKPRKPAEIMWDLYGSSGEEDQVIRLKRVRLA
ncbi:MAG: alkaline phosphatase family protein [Gammaproteobacteria bacterium]|nr:alkaline phosphatase family protein [Gammaproteobacteria bacterium]